MFFDLQRPQVDFPQFLSNCLFAGHLEFFLHFGFFLTCDGRKSNKARVATEQNVSCGGTHGTVAGWRLDDLRRRQVENLGKI